MQHLTIRMALAAPLALLIGAAPALAQGTSSPAGEPPGAERANATRELEHEIEDYPSPTAGTPGPADPATRIPEAVEPAPPKPAASASSASSAPEARATEAMSIDPREVQRVFGSDTRVIALDSLGAATVTRLQARLQELGHYKGAVDGVAGPQTRAALGAYARAQQALEQRLIQQNQLTTDLAERLGVEPSPRGTGPGSPGLPAEPAAPRDDSPLSPRGAAPLPAPGMPLPTPAQGPAPGPSGVTPPAPPPSP